MAHHNRLLVSSLLLAWACASPRPAPTSAPVQAPPTATAAPDTAWPDTIEGRWVKMGESQNRGGNYIDRETLVRDGGNGGSAWVRLYHKDHAYDEQEQEFICRTWKVRATQSSSYNPQGEVVYSIIQPTPWMSPSPGSVAEGVMLLVCAR
jgi:Surface-adhesin protein E